MFKNRFLKFFNTDGASGGATPPADPPADPPAPPADPPAKPDTPPDDGKGDGDDGKGDGDGDKKTYSRAEINKMIAAERQKAKAEAEAEAKEAQRLANLGEKERAEEERKKLLQENELLKAEKARKEAVTETVTELTSRKLPLDFAEMLTTDTAEKTLENIKSFESSFNKAVQAQVEVRLNSPNPPQNLEGNEPGNPFNFSFAGVRDAKK